MLERTKVAHSSDRAKASTTHKPFTFLRSESRRIDETASAASSALVNSESSPPSAIKRSSPTSPCIRGEGVAFWAEGLQTEIGRTFKGGSAALLLLQQRMSDAAHPPPRTPRPNRATPVSLTRTWVCDPRSLTGDGGTDAPNFGALPQAGRLL